MWRWQNRGFTLHRTEKSSQLEAIGKISSVWRCTFLDTHLFWKGKGSHSSWSIIFLPHFFVCKTTLIKTWDSLAFILLKAFLWVAEVRITIYNRQIISFLCGLLVFSVFFCNRHFLSFWCIFFSRFLKTAEVRMTLYNGHFLSGAFWQPSKWHPKHPSTHTIHWKVSPSTKSKNLNIQDLTICDPQSKQKHLQWKRKSLVNENHSGSKTKICEP